MQEICVFCFINRRLQIFVDIHNLWPKVQPYFTGLSHAMFAYRNYGRAVGIFFQRVLIYYKSIKFFITTNILVRYISII